MRQGAGIGARRRGDVSIHALLAECDLASIRGPGNLRRFNPRTPCGVRLKDGMKRYDAYQFQSTHSLRSATEGHTYYAARQMVSIHALLAECDLAGREANRGNRSFNPRTPCGVRPAKSAPVRLAPVFQSTHSLRSATIIAHIRRPMLKFQSTHSLRSATSWRQIASPVALFQSTHSLRSATAPNLIHCYSTKQIILCANLPKKTVIARLLFLSIYLSIFYSQCITPIADLPGNSCELEVGAQAMFNSL